MIQLQYKTRENTTPHGKANVYYTAHPEDTVNFLADIQNQILYLQNCVIWHDSETERQIDDSFLSELALMNMQLMVIPVTKKLLTTANRVTENELAFAREHHIAVLPIMMEPGLDRWYAKVFGDLQYLDTSNEDSTAIPYQEKLEKYLESVLVGDKTLQDIHNAFDAQVFLSYRKKDRQLAQKLMELIHQIPEMESVGIWYDEFLIPGEGFNGGIQDAIQKSDLFVLAMTKSLINEDNFVQANEYKWIWQWATKKYAEACRSRIVPAKLEETDRTVTEDRFPNIPDDVDPQQEDAFYHALVEPLRNQLISHIDEPMHQYLMGLAYLHGISMLPNHEKGKHLLEQAAQAGVLDARKKLVHMYFRGYGVEQSYATAIYWQQQVVALCKERYEQSQSDTDWFAYTWELIYLGDDLVHMCLWEDAIVSFTEAQKLLEAQLQKEDTLRYRERLAYVCNELGIACSRISQDSNAIAAHKKAIEVTEEIKWENASVLLRRYCAHSHSNLGATYQSIGHSHEALYHCKKAWELANRLLKENEETDTQRLKAEASYHLGNIYSDHGQWDQAEQYCIDALTTMNGLTGPLAKIDDLLFMVECLRLAGHCCEYQEKYDAAESAYQKSIILVQPLLQVQNTEQMQQTFWRAKQDLETLYIRIDGAKGNLRPAFVKEADTRAEKDPTPQNRRSQIEAHTQWAKACVRGGNYEKSQMCFRKVITLLEALSQQSNEEKDALAICLIKIELVEAMQRSPHKGDLPKVLAEVITQCEALLSEDVAAEDQLAIRKALARAYIYRGRFFQDMSDRFSEEALQWFIKALPLLELLVQKTSHLHMRLFAAECKADIAVNALYTKKELYRHYCDTYSLAALDEMEGIYKIDQALETTKCMAKCRQIRALILWSSDNKQEARPHFSQAYNLYAELAKKTTEAYYLNQSALMLYFTASYANEKKKKQLLQEALVLAEKAYHANPFNAQFRKTVSVIKDELK